jgi:hypothetical protein
MRGRFVNRSFAGINNNDEHHHSGIALLTPYMLHYARAQEVIQQRQHDLDRTYARNPERLVRACPNPSHRQPPPGLTRRDLTPSHWLLTATNHRTIDSKMP